MKIAVLYDVWEEGGGPPEEKPPEEEPVPRARKRRQDCRYHDCRGVLRLKRV